ncbi:MAG: hypothetical protein SV186_04950 [Candidatus Nanohaloarchaea archaeon]|nr:hypothetical protein [Candidatus Nanohaloarchaea archaeon]
MAPINFDADDMEAAEEHSLDRYQGEDRVEGTVQDMLDNLTEQA